MKYFDKDFMLGNLSDEETENRIKKYKEQIECILKKSDYNMRLLISYISLHDAQIKKIETTDNALQIQISGGDNQSGHFSLIIYFDVKSKIDANNIVLPFNIVYYEYDFSKEYILSLISDDEREIEIKFNKVSIRIDNK